MNVGFVRRDEYVMSFLAKPLQSTHLEYSSNVEAAATVR